MTGLTLNRRKLVDAIKRDQNGVSAIAIKE